MTVPAIHCEVKKLAYRQSKDGLVVSFLVHPQEMPDALATAPLGQRYMLALVQIGDDEQPVDPASVPERRPAGTDSPQGTGGAQAFDIHGSSVFEGGAKSSGQPGGGTREKRAWYEMPPSQRAGIMCGEKRFRIWLTNFKGVHINDEDEATNWLYQECGIHSRRELTLDTAASPDVQAFQREQLRVFYEIERDYRKWAGLEMEVR